MNEIIICLYYMSNDSYIKEFKINGNNNIYIYNNTKIILNNFMKINTVIKYKMTRHTFKRICIKKNK